MVGSRFLELASSGAQFMKTDLYSKNPTDITNKSSIESFFKSNDYDYVILFSAFTDVDAAEKQRNDKDALCWQINVEGTRNVTEIARKFKRKMIFISTDFIFDGHNGPYSENAPVGPDLSKVGWYGITKIEAEKIVMTLPSYVILRISYPYRSQFDKKLDYARSILEKYQEEKLLPRFVDQQITPTFIDDVPGAILLLIEKNQDGIFHLASPLTVSPYNFAKELLRVFGKNTDKLKESLLKDLIKSSNVPRPIKGGMISNKIQMLGFSPTDWKKGIVEIYKQQKA